MEHKQHPIEINEFYSPGLNSLKRIYTQHPRFNGNTRLIYELLFDYWHPDYGYAFPTQWDLERNSGMSRKSVNKQIGILEDLDLIEIRKSPVGNRKNNVYIVKAPVTTMDQFYEKFPEVKDKVKERLNRSKAEEEKLQRKWAQDKSEGKAYTQKDKDDDSDRQDEGKSDNESEQGLDNGEQPKPKPSPTTSSPPAESNIVTLYEGKPESDRPPKQTKAAEQDEDHDKHDEYDEIEAFF